MPTAIPDTSPTRPRSVVVVGAGLAGAQTVAALRQHGFEGRLTVLGDEDVPPYDRPPLSKELFTRTEPLWLADDLGIDLDALADDVRLGDPATALLADRSGPGPAVRTRRGDVVEADAVVVATGSRPVLPTGWQARVLHTAADAASLRDALTPGSRLLVIGAGWIGAEVSGAARAAGVDVTVLEAAETPLARQLGTAVGEHLIGWFDAAGVDLRLRSPAHEVRADGVTLPTGERFDADVVLAAVGARPATGWLRDAVPDPAFDTTGSLRVDAAGAVVGVPGLWAVGDTAVRPHPVFGPVPGGHWSAALHDPNGVARGILGLELPDPHAPYVFSRQLGHDLALFGLPEGSPTAWRGRPGEGPWAAFWTDPQPVARHDGAGPGAHDDGTAVVRAVLLADSPREVGAVRRLMNRPEPLRLDLARATDPAVKLRHAVAP